MRNGDVALQFDAGRSTVMRLTEAGTPPEALDALFLTHEHCDHVVGLPDVAMTRWIQQQLVASGPLVIVAPEGVAARFVGMLIPPPEGRSDAEAFVQDLRAGGYAGTITVGEDLSTVVI